MRQSDILIKDLMRYISENRDCDDIGYYLYEIKMLKKIGNEIEKNDNED